MKALVQTILNATAAGKSMLLAANAAAQKVLLSLGNVDNTSDANKPVSTAQQTALDAKQSTLVSGTNIKTVGGTSLLGSGNIAVGSGDVVGPASATDNAVTRFDATTGKLVQNSAVTIDDSGNATGFGTLNTSGKITSATQVDANFFKSTTTAGYFGIVSRCTIYGGSVDGSVVLTDWSTGVTLATLSCGAITSNALMCCGVYTFATVPSASSNTGKFLRISDRAQKHAYSDGTNWRFFGDDAIIS